MFRQTIFALLVAALAIAIVACSTAPTPTPVSPTVAPQPTAVPKASASSSSGPASSNAVATTKVDLKASGVAYTFQVDPSQSEASYAVQELFFGKPTAQTTVGSTNVVEGQFVAALQNGKLVLQSNQFKVDLRTLKSDSPVRDQAIQRGWLEAAKYPFAEFTSTSIDGMPATLQEGQPISIKISGNMTIRNITKPVTFDAQATLTNGNTITGSGVTHLLMKDFGFDAPDIAGRLTVTDGVTLTVKGVAKLTK